MRRFSSYGPVNTKLHYYVPRQVLIDQAYSQLVGEEPEEGGHYITVWAPRQRGKSWVMREVYQRLLHQHAEQFDVVALSLQDLTTTVETEQVIQAIAAELSAKLSLPPLQTYTPRSFGQFFYRDRLTKPLILILDEFDTLPQAAINVLAAVLRNIYNSRQYQSDKPSAEKDYLLHGVALIGVRAVLGIENQTGSPFNVQRSVHIPNLTFEEVQEMYRWYERESGQAVEQAVIDRVFYETQGQPGLVSWLGELLTETYNEHNPSITKRDLDHVCSSDRRVA
jgi:hypothetical protein